ncbi:hypothetical protein [uncultured Brachyspira sp.]|uniref:hypothetical protein n=1 Tax=uncultured Brachyspira sp. TaxID=221953 RepID=UPI002591BA11|nr:hypothetical protein [uncultured Brachyspira sp.]
MSNKKFNLKILMLASWVLLFFAWIFFYAVTQRPTITFLIVLSISAIITIITVILERKSIITLFRMRFVHKAFFGILSLIIILAILIGLYLEPSLSLTLIDGKNIAISGTSKRGPFFTLGWVVYGEIFLTQIPEIELYIAFEIRLAW